MSRQISAIVSNASSSLDFFNRRSFSFGGFCLGGNVLLARAAFDAADPFVAIAGRDLRFGAIMCETRRGRSRFLVRLQYNSKRSDAASTCKGSCKRAFRDGW
jgi:hypothetical protein